ncbi:FAD-dependent oxidoreductase, partial [Nocardia nova]|uniref:FAD-dependent oxidoreductase n=2 Tax=Nocardia TaxID=1817 RepID=UPI0025AFBF41
MPTDETADSSPTDSGTAATVRDLPVRDRGLDENDCPEGEFADVVVVGARCAGSAAAIAFARAGRRVVVVDAARFPSDTLSTHLLWPAGIAEVAALGALEKVLALGAPQLRVAYAGGAGQVVRA